MPDSPHTLLQIDASARKLSVDYGAMSLEELVAWADGLILEQEEPLVALIDLSLARKMSQALTALGKIGASADKPQVARLVFQFFHAALSSDRADYRGVVKGLYEMSMEGYVPAPGCEDEMSRYWDDLDLADEGIYGDPGEVRAKVQAFLKRFKA